MLKRVCAAIIVATLLINAGCRSGAAGESFLNVFGLAEKPLVVAICGAPGEINPFAKYESLRVALKNDLDRPVRLDLALPFQLGPNLALGFYDYAILTPAQYAAIPKQTEFKIVAASVDESLRQVRSAVMLVPTDSAIRGVPDVKGKKVVFGAPFDSRSFVSALAMLESKGVQKSDLAATLLPLPRHYEHITDPSQRIAAVRSGKFDVTFLDERDFAALPATSDSGELSRADFRILARTAPLPDLVVVRSKNIDDALTLRVVNCLTTMHERDAEVLGSLRVAKFVVPAEEVALACQNLVAPEEAEMPGKNASPEFADDAER